jgi:tricorn protease-like protein
MLNHNFLKPLAIALFSIISISGCSLLAPVDRAKYSDLEGHIFSVDTNAPVYNADINVLEPNSGDHTDRNGKFLIRGLPVDWVTVEVKAPGHQTLRRKVKIEPYGSKFINFWVSHDNTAVKGDKIVFERDGDLWLSDEFGINQQNITDKLKSQNFNPGGNLGFAYKSPIWLSDKSKIAYIVLDNSITPSTKNGLWMMSPNGKMNQRLTYIDATAMALTSDKMGNSFVFSMIDPDNSTSIGLYKYSRVKNKVEALSGSLADDTNPRWSEKNQMIAYTSGITENPNIVNYDINQYPSSRFQIFTMNANGYGRKQLTQSGENYDPAWSPDGEKIAFISNRTGATELWEMNKDGSGQRSLTTMGATRANNPVWSANGQRILFNSNYMQKYSALNATEAWIYEPANYSLRMVTNDANRPSW